MQSCRDLPTAKALLDTEVLLSEDLICIGLVAIPTAYAVDYSGISEDRIKYVVKQSGWLDILRIVLWKILVGCAELIDGIYQAINKLLEVNIYDLWIKNIPFFSSGVGKIAAALAA